jgi:hypothetical protein
VHEAHWLLQKAEVDGVSPALLLEGSMDGPASANPQHLHLVPSPWVLARPHLAHNVSHVSLPYMGMWVEQHVRCRAVAQVGVMALADACTVAMHTQLSAI